MFFPFANCIGIPIIVGPKSTDVTVVPVSMSIALDVFCGQLGPKTNLPAFSTYEPGSGTLTVITIGSAPIHTYGLPSTVSTPYGFLTSTTSGEPAVTNVNRPLDQRALGRLPSTNWNAASASGPTSLRASTG